MDSIDRKLLRKFFNKECSADEMRQVLRWLKDPDNRDEVETLLGIQWNEAGDHVNPDSDLEKLYENVLHEITEHTARTKTRKLFPYRTYLGIAAAVALLIVSSVAIMKLNVGTGEQNGVKTIGKSAGQGEKLTVQLPDGTIATLNSESKIQFPEQFGDHERRITLTGEACFDVAKDPYRPFTVASESISVTALGTSFNVNAFSEYNEMKVTLLSGRVLVADAAGHHSAILDEGEAAVFKKRNGTIEKMKVEARLSVLWKDGIIYFHKTPLHEVIKTLERWYGVNFEVAGRPQPDPEFYGAFENTSLDNVLKSMGFALGFDYAIRNNTVTIQFKK